LIIDTSGLIAAAAEEPGWGELVDAMAPGGLVPAPVVVEFYRVATKRGSVQAPEAEAFLQDLLSNELTVEPFTAEDAEIAAVANQAYGTGNGRGGRLNMLDLMVYAMARRTGRPILCTGTDFQSTDAAIHEASRDW